MGLAVEEELRPLAVQRVHLQAVTMEAVSVPQAVLRGGGWDQQSLLLLCVVGVVGDAT